MAKAITLFKETERQVLNVDFIVYVCGEDVSDYVEDITIHYSDREGYNTADIRLANPMDQWVLRFQNFQNYWRFKGEGSKYSEQEKRAIYIKKKALVALEGKRDALMKRIFPSDGSHVNKPSDREIDSIIDNAETSAFTEGNRTALQAAAKQVGPADDTFLQRYSFGPGACVFSKMDPVKVFIKNPSDVPDKQDRWIPAFTGLIDKKPLQTDYLTGRSTVSIQAYDIRASMQNMRVSTNPVKNEFVDSGISNPKSVNAVFDTFKSGVFRDFFVRSDNIQGNVFAGKTFVDMVSMITTGQVGWVNDGQPVTEGSGVGIFTPGQVYRYLPIKRKKTGTKKNVVSDLSDWDRLCLFGERKRFWTTQECRTAGRNSFWKTEFEKDPITKKPKQGHPFAGKVHFLLPSEELHVSDLIGFEGPNNITSSPDWESRFELITNICRQLDYQWGVTGCGDIIFEFPMYDFFPTNFKDHAHLYVVNRHATSDNVSDESGDVVAAVELTTVSKNKIQGAIDQSNINVVQNNGPVADLSLTGQVRAVAGSETLASRYGARVVSETITGLRSGFQQGDNLVRERLLKQMAVLSLQRRNANANVASVDFHYRPLIRPNRPLHHKERERIGVTKDVTVSIPVYPNEPKTDANLGCVRLPILTYDSKKKRRTVSYQQITGGPGMTLSYNDVYEGPDPTASGKSVNDSRLGNPGGGIQVTVQEGTRDKPK